MRKRLILNLILIFGSAGLLVSCSNKNSSEDNVSREVAAAEGDNSPETIDNFVYTGNPFECPQFKIADNIIISDNLPVVVDFYADWCNPCKQYSPYFHAAAEKYQGQAVFVSINTDDYPEIANRYEVKEIPTTVFICPGGETLGAQSGIIPEDQLNTFINQLIATSDGIQSGI